MSELQAKAQITLTKLKDGTRGATWYDGAAEPWNYEFPSDTKVGDYYLYTTTGEVYLLNSLPTTIESHWDDKGNIKGNTGRGIRGIQKWYSINNSLPIIDSIDNTGKPISRDLIKDWQIYEFTDEEITALLENEKVYSTDIVKYDSAPFYGESPWLVNEVGSYITLKGLVRFKNTITNDNEDVPVEDTIINGGYIKTNSIIANRLSVDKLSAITSNVGTLTTGFIQNDNYNKSDKDNFSISGMSIDLNSGTIQTPSFYTLSGEAGFKGYLSCDSGNIGNLQLDNGSLISPDYSYEGDAGFKLGDQGEIIINSGIFNGELLNINPHHRLYQPISLVGYYKFKNTNYFSRFYMSSDEINLQNNGITISTGKATTKDLSYRLVNRPNASQKDKGDYDVLRKDIAYYQDDSHGNKQIVYNVHEYDYYAPNLFESSTGKFYYLGYYNKNQETKEEKIEILYPNIINLDDEEVSSKPKFKFYRNNNDDNPWTWPGKEQGLDPVPVEITSEIKEAFYTYKNNYYIIDSGNPLDISSETYNNININHNNIHIFNNNKTWVSINQYKTLVQTLESYKINIVQDPEINSNVGGYISHNYSWVNNNGILKLIMY